MMEELGWVVALTVGALVRRLEADLRGRGELPDLLAQVSALADIRSGVGGRVRGLAPSGVGSRHDQHVPRRSPGKASIRRTV